MSMYDICSPVWEEFIRIVEMANHLVRFEMCQEMESLFSFGKNLEFTCRKVTYLHV